jgi:hypothetical protein
MAAATFYQTKQPRGVQSNTSWIRLVTLLDKGRSWCVHVDHNSRRFHGGRKQRSGAKTLSKILWARAFARASLQQVKNFNARSPGRWISLLIRVVLNEAF